SLAAAVVGLAGRWRPPPGRLRALGRPAGPQARPGSAGKAVAARAVAVAAVVAAGLAHPLLGGLLAVAALGRAPLAPRRAPRRAAGAVEAALPEVVDLVAPALGGGPAV